MKAAFNGALNLSLDGWWDENCSERAGWAIGAGEDYDDEDYQDRVGAGSLYELLDPPSFRSSTTGRRPPPRGWIST
jgi:starch phosphorylase